MPRGRRRACNWRHNRNQGIAYLRRQPVQAIGATSDHLKPHQHYRRNVSLTFGAQAKPSMEKAMSKPNTAAAAAKTGRKKIILLAIVALLFAGSAGAWFSGLLPAMAKSEATNPGETKEHERDKGNAKPEKSAPIFMDLPDIVVNLNTGQRRAVFLKLQAKLELSQPEDKAIVQAAMPRVLDLFQGYLREMRPEELRGTASTYRMREELLARANLAVSPLQIITVIFNQMLVQ